MKLFISSKIPEDVLKRLDGFDYTYHDSNDPLSADEIVTGLQGKEALICPLSDKIDKAIIDRAGDLKIILNYGAGFDNIDIDYAREKGIVVCNAPAPSSAVSTAELTFALLLAQARHLIQGNEDLRSGGFKGWRPTYFLGQQLKGKTLGIFGMGNIGSNLAKRALAFDMSVIYYSRHRKEDIEALGARYVSFDELLRESDFLSVHSAFVPELKHTFDAEAFKAMKHTATFINAARGPLIDERALADALKANEIAGAALDVYEFEPRVTEALFDLDNVTLAPHLGNATAEARLEMGHACVDNLNDYCDGKRPRNQVN
ncbi:MAG: NAD(P)-dependent oxidoreductase [Peptoniphilus sp.]|nr:NAD(P)-dependent oxidoreductase [Peptoniphilus sp.]MDD7362951.1 NAD(P)-dependent oxidoreductase [Bacillota bacterium]MDY6044191.1 NAD(P)-dependent oxidoreductase [Peptoniphilus sp.]